ncbi:MAG TPA: TetR/AcrR family transcriptional regulator [Actinomycetales bacterium]|nr:TetR/AcrR family transcriptional regulator [Actinomycetales bacterium]
MGNREDLIAGARRCLYEKGYEHTSARDIAAASGTSLAAIGYHFGSKEALLKVALIEATQEWGAELERAVSTDLDPDASQEERFRSTWTRVIESFSRHRDLWATHFRMLVHVENVPDEGKPFVGALQQGREGLAHMLLDTEGMSADAVSKVGTVFHALLTGVMAQWLVDPDHAPSAEDLTEGMRTIAQAIAGGGPRG